MLLSGTVVVDAETVIEEGAVVVSGATIEAVGDVAALHERYPGHEHRSFDVVAPGIVNAHVHSVQSLGRGIADDEELLEWLYDAVLPMEAALDADEMKIAAKLGYLELIESGVTAVVDHPSVHHADRVIEAAGEMGIRARVGKVLMDQRSPDGLEESTEAALAESERLLEGYHDSYDGRIKYALTPRFAVSCSEECLRGVRRIADDHDDVLIHTHASENRSEIETVAEDTGMRNVHWLDEVGLTGEDVLLAHCVWTDESERAVLAETGTSVVHCPSANMKLASGVAPVADYRERGVTVALGNDGPPCNNVLDPFTEMRQASLLAKVDGLDPTVLPAESVLEMATVAGAAAAGFSRVGALREGWRADVIGVETEGVSRATPTYDARSHLVYAARGDDVCFSMVDGRVLLDDGEVTTADADAIRTEARAVADRLRERGGAGGDPDD